MVTAETDSWMTSGWAVQGSPSGSCSSVRNEQLMFKVRAAQTNQRVILPLLKGVVVVVGGLSTMWPVSVCSCLNSHGVWGRGMLDVISSPFQNQAEFWLLCSIRPTNMSSGVHQSLLWTQPAAVPSSSPTRPFGMWFSIVNASITDVEKTRGGMGKNLLIRYRRIAGGWGGIIYCDSIGETVCGD